MSHAPTIILAGTVISGRVEGAEDVQVLGTLRGSLRLDGSLFVEKQGRVEADVVATSVEIQGILVGTVTATDYVELQESARVIGDLAAPRVIVRDGAAFRGLIDMGDVEAAVPTGEIKAQPGRGVQPPVGRGAPQPMKAPLGRPQAAPSSVSPTRPNSAPMARPAAPPAGRPLPQPAPVPEPAPQEKPEEPLAEPELPDDALAKSVTVKKKK